MRIPAAWLPDGKKIPYDLRPVPTDDERKRLLITVGQEPLEEVGVGCGGQGEPRAQLDDQIGEVRGLHLAVGVVGKGDLASVIHADQPARPVSGKIFR